MDEITIIMDKLEEAENDLSEIEKEPVPDPFELGLAFGYRDAIKDILDLLGAR